MSGKGLLVSFVSGVLVCVAINGNAHESEPPTHFVKVPTVVTHTVTKEVSVPLPGSCKRLIDLYTTAAKSEGAISSSAGAIDDSLSDLIRDVQARNVAGLNSAKQIVIDQRKILTSAQNDRSSALLNVDYLTNKCNTDIKEANK